MACEVVWRIQHSVKSQYFLPEFLRHTPEVVVVIPPDLQHAEPLIHEYEDHDHAGVGGGARLTDPWSLMGSYY